MKASVSGNYSSPSSGLTTAGIDTSSANFLVAAVAYLTGIGTPTLSDSNTNTWHPLTENALAGVAIDVYYAYNAIVGAAHTFTVTGANTFASVCIGAFGGIKSASDPFDKQDSAGGGAGLSTAQVTTGFTPTNNNSLVIGALAGSANAFPTSIDGGFIIPQKVHGDGTNYLSCGLAYLVQTTKTFAQPVWTLTGVSSVAVEQSNFDTP